MPRLAPLPLIVGTYVAIREHDRYMPYLVDEIIEGHPAVHGVAPEAIPAGTLIQPAKWTPTGLVAATTSPWLAFDKTTMAG